MKQFENPSVEQVVSGRFLSVPYQLIECKAVESGFSGAAISNIKSSGNEYALRRWTPPCLPLNRIFELHRFLAYLKSNDIPVAVPASEPETRDSLIFHEKTHWQLEPWLPGFPIAVSTLNAESLGSMMQILARMHHAAANYIASPQGVEWFGVSQRRVPAVTERLNLIEKWTLHRIKNCERSLQSAPDEFQELAIQILDLYRCSSSRVKEQLKSFVDIRCQTFPCWRDLWRDHVLFAKGEVSGLIDASATRSDHPGTDLSRLLGSLFGDDKNQWRQAINIYQDVRRLSTVDLELIDVLDLSSVLLSGMTWIHRWEMQGLNRNQLPAIIERMKVIAARLKTLSFDLN